MFLMLGNSPKNRHDHQQVIKPAHLAHFIGHRWLSALYLIGHTCLLFGLAEVTEAKFHIFPSLGRIIYLGGP